MSLAMEALVGLAVTVIVLWLAFLVTLVVVRPRGLNLREAKRLVPDTLRLLRALHGDTELPRSVRRWLTALAVYLAVPFDIIPDVIPVIGYADDVIIVAFVLRRVLRRAGPDVLEHHWTGSPAGLAALRRLAGLTDREV
jgi:uncharacterized membrane protein YkvA (DUF1232 family)